eukprot:SM000044S16013  [mRNA]  locus=s44:510671:512595:- [translate_table: standard]
MPTRRAELLRLVSAAGLSFLWAAGRRRLCCGCVQAQPGGHRSPSYWSSRGSADCDAPETLTYSLATDVSVVRAGSPLLTTPVPRQAEHQGGSTYAADLEPYRGISVEFDQVHKLTRLLCSYPPPSLLPLALPLVHNWQVHEVWIRPYQACFQLGDPIYSAKFVRFRLGRQLCGDGKELPRYQWSAETPTYAMLQVELLGRMQKQASDNLYYIWSVPPLQARETDMPAIASAVTKLSSSPGLVLLLHVCHVRVIGRLLHHFRSYLSATDGLVLLYNEGVLGPAAMAELRQAARGEGKEEAQEGPLQASWNSNVPAGEALDHLVAMMQDAPREARWLAEHLPETYRNLGLLYGTGNVLAVAGQPDRGGSSNADGLHDYEGLDDDNEHDDWERED